MGQCYATRAQLPRSILLLTLLAAFLFACGSTNAPIGDIPKPEHPRPDFERARWANLYFNYDRTPKEFGYETFVDGMTVADLQGPDFVGFDAPPLIEARPGSKVSVPVFVSHFSDVGAWLTGTNDLGGDIELFAKEREVR